MKSSTALAALLALEIMFVPQIAGAQMDQETMVPAATPTGPGLGDAQDSPNPFQSPNPFESPNSFQSPNPFATPYTTPGPGATAVVSTNSGSGGDWGLIGLLGLLGLLGLRRRRM